MTLFSLGPLYAGWDRDSFNGVWVSRAMCIHLGHLRLEWDCPAQGSHGSTQEAANQPPA